ncbi:BrnT family toxin [Pseudohaliea sp.]|uniref:BrnT family toxin n=1 Tax=Pseudohaliea sp. TaxID=2740289 RepID=UPI0032EC7104
MCYKAILEKSKFKWDEAKNAANQRKHCVSFYEAQYAFLDELRIIAEDLSHSQKERRYY